MESRTVAGVKLRSGCNSERILTERPKSSTSTVVSKAIVESAAIAEEQSETVRSIAQSATELRGEMTTLAQTASAVDVETQELGALVDAFVMQHAGGEPQASPDRQPTSAAAYATR